MSSHDFHQFLQGILLEVAIDNRVPTGLVDFSNHLHVEILAEKMFGRGIDVDIIREVVDKIAIRDGKYPDRQAYNKEGWLVTFPSPEHRAEAIKNRTHFASDPTHGQGGMNLYYKRKGKQARQKTQGSSESDIEQDDQSAKTQTSQAPVDQVDTNTDNDESPTEPNGGQSTNGSSLPASDSAGGDQPSDTNTPADTQGSAASSSGAESNGGATDTGSAQSSQQPQPAPEPVANVELIKLTIEFAKSKSWTTTPYGDWNDEHGQTAAVTALDGQVVPLKFSDRETLKSLAAKRNIKLPKQDDVAT